MLHLVCNKHESVPQSIYMIKGKKHNGLIISGHSLGGAMATLLAAELWTDYQRSSSNFPFHNLHITTFGAPRVFDDSTARDMFSNFKPGMLALYYIHAHNE